MESSPPDDRHSKTEPRWELMLPVIEEVQELKRSRRALVLAHRYQRVEVFHGVADVRGDDLTVALAASRLDADVLVVCGVRFMAETVKVLNPTRRVLIPIEEALCAVADSITPADVDALRELHPGCPVVAYMNTTAAVKARADVCCTADNATQIVAALGVPEVIMVPDRNLARFVESSTGVRVHAWDRTCPAHDVFSVEDIAKIRAMHPKAVVAAHVECRAAVHAAADFVGSTAELMQWLRTTRPTQVAVAAEAGMIDNLRDELADIEFVQPCSLCPQMRRVTLRKVRDALLEDRFEIELSPAVVVAARRSLAQMIGFMQISPG